MNRFEPVLTGYLRSSPVIWGLAIIGNRLRLRSVEIWPKNRTGPDFQTLAGRNLVGIREYDGFVNLHGLRARVGWGTGAGWQSTTLEKPPPVVKVSQVCTLLLNLLIYRLRRLDAEISCCHCTCSVWCDPSAERDFFFSTPDLKSPVPSVLNVFFIDFGSLLPAWPSHLSVGLL